METIKVISKTLKLFSRVKTQQTAIKSERYCQDNNALCLGMTMKTETRLFTHFLDFTIKILKYYSFKHIQNPTGFEIFSYSTVFFSFV